VNKNADPILSPSWTKVHVILRRYRRLIRVACALARLSMRCFVPKMPLRLPLRCEIVENGGFGALDL